jgi:peptide deformylase
MVYPIVKYGDPVLEREADQVTDFGTPELEQFLEDMFESMYAAKGVGLAAPQIGFSRKIASSTFLTRRIRPTSSCSSIRRLCTWRASRLAKRAA